MLVGSLLATVVRGAPVCSVDTKGALWSIS
jgi:hypothetical protein